MPSEIQSEAEIHVISGASSGIGLATARRLLEQGGRVVGLSRTAGPLQNHDHYEFVYCDFSDLKALAETLAALRRKLSGLRAVISSAGYGRFGALEEFSPDQIERLVDVNLTGQILLLREMLPLLKRQRGGDVVVIGSEAALRGGQRGAVYSATKFALRGLTQSLREECAGSGVRVTQINPGMVDTPFFQQQPFRPSPEPGCQLQAEDVASAVIYALSQRTGICVDEINLSPQKKVIDFGEADQS